MLKSYAERYRRDLVKSVIPFWLKHSLDREYGGYFTCLDQDGTVYDDKKYLWLQGREVWMFARLYNEFDRNSEFLEAASLGLNFIRRYGKDPHGRVYFALTRDGRPYAYQRKPFAAVFYTMGLLEYYKATSDQSCFDEAVEMFWAINEWIKQPERMDRPILSGQRSVSSLAGIMVLSCLAMEFLQVHDDPRYLQVLQEAADHVKKHFDPQRRILRETVSLDGEDITHWPEGRLFIPGHSIEVAWFLLHMLNHLSDASLRQLALEVIEGSLELGWDKEFGGLYYFMDLEGKPTLQLEASMKLWWPHTETIYALILAYTLSREDRWLRWLEKVNDYSYRHFVDHEHGEWFGYCDRRGHLTHTCKGGNYKGFFHVPRALLMSIQQIERMDK